MNVQNNIETSTGSKPSSFIPSLKTLLNIAPVAFFALLLIFPEAATAAGSPFGEAESKGEDLLDLLQGSIGVIVMTLAIIIGGMGLLFNLIQKTWALRVIGAGILIGSATSIAEWLIN